MTQYSWNYDHVPPLAMSNDVPKAERPALSWLAKVAAVAARVAANELLAGQKGPPLAGLAATGEATGGSAGRATTLVQTAEATVPVLSHNALAALQGLETDGPAGLAADAEALAALEKLAASFDREDFDPNTIVAELRQAMAKAQGDAVDDALVPQGLALFGGGDPNDPYKAYKKLFRVLPYPRTVADGMSDRAFADLRVAGFHPTRLRGVTPATLPDVPFDDADLAAVFPGDTLAAAAAEQRLYMVSYPELVGATPGDFGCGQKYVVAPIGLFALPPGSGDGASLEAIAVRLGQDPSAWPVIRRGAPQWADAKSGLTMADADVHELVAHLAHTHLLVEPFVVATHRVLDDAHPVSVLLRPHFEGTIFINNSAQATLITAGHQVDAALSPTIDASRTISVNALRGDFRFNDQLLPARLAAANVLSSKLAFPYRDDALKVWNILHQWVTTYVGMNYADDAAVQADVQLQAWARELVAQDGGRVQGFGEAADGSITHRSYLVDALTLVIFTGSAQHAAVNFPQASLMAYAPAVPGALFSAVPRNPPGADQVAVIPPLPCAMMQASFLSLLGGVYHTRLGDYPARWFDKKYNDALDLLTAQLAQLDAAIAADAPSRPFQYDFLRPSLIPQSINI